MHNTNCTGDVRRDIERGINREPFDPKIMQTDPTATLKELFDKNHLDVFIPDSSKVTRQQMENLLADIPVMPNGIIEAQRVIKAIKASDPCRQIRRTKLGRF